MATPQPTKLRSGKEIYPPTEQTASEVDNNRGSGHGSPDRDESAHGVAQDKPDILLTPTARLQSPSMAGTSLKNPVRDMDVDEMFVPARYDNEGDVRRTDRAQRIDKERENRPYHHYGGDPDPPGPGIGKKDLGEQLRLSRDYSTVLYSAYNRTESLTGEVLWQDFISAFRPHTLRNWTPAMIVEWRALLLERGIYLDPNRERQRVESIIDLLYRDTHKPASEQDVLRIKADNCQTKVARDAGKMTEGHVPNTNNDKMEEKETGTVLTPKSVQGKNTVSIRPDMGDPDGDDSSSSEEEDKDQGSSGGKRRRENKNLGRGDKSQGSEKTGGSEDPNRTYEKGSAITSMIKTFADMTKYGGSFQEDLDETIEAFETVAELCDITTDSQKKKAIPIMLKGSAFRLYSRNKHLITSYEDGISALKGWYDSKEKQTRLLKEWNHMKLTESLAEDPSKSELDVFKTFVDRSMAVQQQLHSSYHGDRQLRDRLMNGVDIPTIQDVLTDRQPRTSHQLVERVANKLSHKPGTAGTSIALLTSNEKVKAKVISKDQTYYSLGQTYGGEATRKINHYGPRQYQGRYNSNPHFRKGDSDLRKNDHRQGNSNYRQRRPTPWWMKGVKGCFVCRKLDHNANEKHTREEVSLAIKRLKMKHPTALLTEEDHAFITDMFTTETAEEGEESEPEANWANEDEGEDTDTEGEVAFIVTEDLENMQAMLTDAAFLHSTDVNATPERMKGPKFSTKQLDSDEAFTGVRIDTCANRTSVIGLPQYVAYCQMFNVTQAMRSVTHKSVNGIGGTERGIGVAPIDIPFQGLQLIIHVKFLVLPRDVPALLSMKDMMTNSLDVSTLKGTISFGNRIQRLRRRNYFLVHEWEPEALSYILYTEQELRTIHRNFGHPSINATANLIRRAQEGALSTDTRQTIDKIAEECSICKRGKGPPRRFKLTVGSHELRFNYTVQIDTMFIRGRPVCHMVDEGTHYTAAQFLKSQTAKEIWKAIQMMWVLVYLGPPDFLSVDQGSSYISQEMRENCATNGITLLEAPIESPGTIGTVERYHAPLRAAYEKIRTDLDKQTTDQECLRMATYAVNCTVGPEGLCPTLLVFGAMPRPIRTRPSPQQIERAETMRKAMKLVEKEQAGRRIAFGLRHGRGPKAIEVSEELRKLPAGAPVLVYRSVRKRWEGPHTFVSIDGETVIVQTKTGRKIHRSVCVRPWIKSTFPAERVDDVDRRKGTTTNENSSTEMAGRGEIQDAAYATNSGGRRTESISRKLPKIGVQPKNAKGFESARKEELMGLLENGTFKATEISDIPRETRIFGSRFVDELKRAAEGRLRHKSRLVAQNYSDHEAAKTPTKAPTIQRFSQRVLLSLAASVEGMTLFSRDITQAYVQSRSALERPVYIKPPLEMGLPGNLVLRVVRPLYGIPESGLHWYLTYLNHHQDRLGMTRTTMDPCFLIRHDEDGNLDGAVVLQVDDSLAIGSEGFLDDEERASKVFKSKPRHLLNQDPTTFNGIRIRKNKEDIFIEQTDKVQKLEKAETTKSFASQRAAAQYVGVNTRPDICANVQLIAPGRDPATKPNIESFNKIIDHLRATKEDGLRFVKLDVDTLKITVISDASFANAHGMRSQLGFVILMEDAAGRANIVHFGSSRCKRVTRSVMASEVHALIVAFDFAYIIQDLLHQILRRPIQIEAYVDSKSVFDIIAKDGRTTERRLQIDISALKESYERGELSKIGWIPGPSNPADALTKETVKINSPLRTLMMTNSISLSPTGWASVSRKRKSKEDKLNPELNDEGENEAADRNGIGTKMRNDEDIGERTLSIEHKTVPVSTHAVESTVSSTRSTLQDDAAGHGQQDE